MLKAKTEPYFAGPNKYTTYCTLFTYGTVLYVTAHFCIGYRPFSLYENSSNLIYSVMKKYV